MMLAVGAPPVSVLMMLDSRVPADAQDAGLSRVSKHSGLSWAFTHNTVLVQLMLMMLVCGGSCSKHGPADARVNVQYVMFEPLYLGCLACNPSTLQPQTLPPPISFTCPFLFH